MLKESPRGMTVTEISKAVQMNRHSVAKYLEVLVAAGHVDMQSFGPSKVYYLSQRIPLSAMLSFSSDLIVIVDKDLIVRNVNDKFLEFMKLDRAQTINRNIENFAYPVKMAPDIVAGIRASLDGREESLDTRFQNGAREQFFTIKFIPTVFDDGEKGVTLIMSDVTDHKHIMDAIKDSERKFRDLIEQSTDGITLSDEKGMIIEYNESMARLTGIAREDVLGKYVWELPFFILGYEQIPGHSQIPGRSPARLKDYVRTFLKTGKSPLTGVQNVFEIERPDGRTRTVQANIFPIKSDQGYMLSSIVRDITEMRRAELAIQESEVKFRSVIEQSLDGILLIDQDGTVVEFNEGLESITGHKKEDILGKPAWEIYNRLVGLKGADAPNSMETLKRHVLSGLNSQATPQRKFFEVGITTPAGQRRVIQALAFRIRLQKNSTICAIARDITEQKLSETLLKESEAKFRNLAETTSSGILIIQEDRIVYANHGAQAITGYTGDELSKVSMGYFIHPEYLKVIDSYKSDYGSLAKMPIKSWEIKIITKERNVRWVDITLGPMVLDGRPAVIKTFFDITERKEAEEALKRERAELETRVKERTLELEQVNAALQGEVDQRRQSEEAVRKSKEKYQNLIESINDVAWEKDRQGRFTYISPKIWDVMGYEPGEFLGKAILDFMDPKDAGDISARYRGLFQEPSNYSFQELRVRHKDGRKVILESSGSPHYNKDGEFQGYRGLARNITERIKIEEELKAEEEKYRTIIESINDIAWEIDREGRFTYVSPKVHDILGFEPGHYLGKPMADFMPEEDGKAFSASFAKMVLEQKPYSLELFQIYHKDGRIIPMEVNSTPIHDDEGRFSGYAGVARDITKRRDMEEMLELMKFSIDHSEDAAFWVRPDASLYYVNDAACRMLGYAREELLRMALRDIDVNFREETWARRLDALRRNKYHKGDSVYRTKGGSTFIVGIAENYLEFNGKVYDFISVRPVSPPKHILAPNIPKPNK